MDETEYKAVYHSVNELRCAFEKALLTRRFQCTRAVKVNIAEREAVGCSSVSAQQACMALRGLLGRGASFALKRTDAQGPLPHAQEVKVQCGGLLGLQDTVDGSDDTATGVNDIHGLLSRAKQQFGALDNIPLQDIAKRVGRYQGRKKRRR